MEINIDYTPHRLQQIIHKDKSRYKVVVAGRRFGKSLLSRWTVLLSALKTPGRYWIVSPTIKQGKDNHWSQPESNILLNTEGWRTYENSSDLAIEIPSKGGKSRIELKGIENLEKTRGAGLHGVVLDEAAFLSKYSWEGVIRPMLLTTRGWALFIGTPNGMNWFKDLYEQGAIHNKVSMKTHKEGKRSCPIWTAESLPNPKPKKEIYKDWSSYHFTSYDSPLNYVWDLEEWRQDAISKKSEDWFFQEYVADFRKVSGLVYKNFDRNIHVVDDVVIDESFEIYRGIDFGFDNPTACVWVAVSKEGKFYVVDEYYETKQSADYHCGVIASKTQQYPHPTASYGDPTAPQVMADWAQKGVYISAARKDMGTNRTDWVGHGIDMIQEKLKVSPIDKKPMLFVHKRCENVIREFETYKWKEEKDETLNNPGRVVKANDHAMDALRYFVVSYRPSDGGDDFPDDSKMFAGGYY